MFVYYVEIDLKVVIGVLGILTTIIVYLMNNTKIISIKSYLTNTNGFEFIILNEGKTPFCIQKIKIIQKESNKNKELIVPYNWYKQYTNDTINLGATSKPITFNDLKFNKSVKTKILITSSLNKKFTSGWFYIEQNVLLKS